MKLATTCLLSCFFFFFNDTATTEIYTLSLHDALPIIGLDSLLPERLVGLGPARERQMQLGLESCHTLHSSTFRLRRRRRVGANSCSLICMRSLACALPARLVLMPA